MKFFLSLIVTLLFFTIAYTQDTTSYKITPTKIYEFKKLRRGALTFFALIDSTSSVLFSESAAHLEGEDQYGIINQRKFTIHPQKKGPWTITEHDSIVATTSYLDFFNFTDALGREYRSSNSTKGDFKIKCALDSKELIEIFVYKVDKKYFIQVTEFFDDSIDHDLTKLMILLHGVFVIEMRKDYGSSVVTSGANLFLRAFLWH